MSEMSTIARPYAKAIFNYAVANKALEEWSAILMLMASVVELPEAKSFFTNPSGTESQSVALLLAPFEKNHKENDALRNWTETLAFEGRIMALPEIYAQFQALREEFEKTILVNVTSFSSLSAKQEENLVARLTEKLNRQVELNVEIDEHVLGGMIIQAGDLVIDGTVRTKLKEMYTDLIA